MMRNDKKKNIYMNTERTHHQLNVGPVAAQLHQRCQVRLETAPRVRQLVGLAKQVRVQEHRRRHNRHVSDNVVQRLSAWVLARRPQNITHRRGVLLAPPRIRLSVGCGWPSAVEVDVEEQRVVVVEAEVEGHKDGAEAAL